MVADQVVLGEPAPTNPHMFGALHTQVAQHS